MAIYIVPDLHRIFVSLVLLLLFALYVNHKAIQLTMVNSRLSEQRFRIAPYNWLNTFMKKLPSHIIEKLIFQNPKSWKIIREITSRIFENQNSKCNFIKNLAPLCAGLIGAMCMKLFQLSDKVHIFFLLRQNCINLTSLCFLARQNLRSCLK